MSVCLRAVVQSARGFTGKAKKRTYYLETSDENDGNENHVYPDINLWNDHELSTP